MNKTKTFLIFISLMGAGFIAGNYQDKQDKDYLDKVHQKVVDNVGPDGYTNYDSDTDTVISEEEKPNDLPWGWERKPEPSVVYVYPQTQKVSETLSDEEIRILREKQSYKSDGSYIYTPGRVVKTREQEIQDYIDKNGRDIYEQLEDEYGN